MTQPRPASDLDRRRLLSAGLGTGALFVGGRSLARAGGAPPSRVAAEPSVPGPFELPKLPYAEDALAPHVSAETLALHHGKHHKGYVDNLNRLVAGKPWAGQDLVAVIRATARDEAAREVFDSAAQVWNHAFYWSSMKPGGGGAPGGALAERVQRDFGDVATLKARLAEAAQTQFGSGYAWLVQDGARLAVVKTSNAHTPLVDGKTPLLTIDVWEHAYYVDRRNRRAEYVAAFLDHLVDWDFAARNLV